MKHFLDGRWVEEKDLKISVMDISVLRGYGVFDLLRTYSQKPFKLSEHIDRLFRSAKLVGIPMRWTKQEIEECVGEGIKKNSRQAKDFNIRLVVTGGVGPDSVTPGEPSLLLIFSRALDYPAHYYNRGVAVTTFVTTRALAAAKTLNYLMGVIALGKAKKAHAVEAIYVDERGKIYEGTTSNFFVVIKGKIYTPHQEILVGVTRQVVIGLAKKLRLAVAEKEIFLKDSKIFDEAFITASNKEIMPVVKIDGQMVGNGKVGRVTQKLLFAYRQMVT